MHTVVSLLVVSALTGAQSAPDSSVTLPPEFVVRSTTINGQQASYRLVDVTIHVWRVFKSGDEARLVIGGAGPTAYYDEGNRRGKSISRKMPATELTALVDSLDLGWLASQESSINYGPRGESVRDFYDVRAQELTLVVRIGEYRKSLTWSSYRSEKNLELPEGISNLLIQLEQSPTVMRAVSEVGVKLSSNSPLQPAPAPRE